MKKLTAVSLLLLMLLSVGCASSKQVAPEKDDKPVKEKVEKGKKSALNLTLMESAIADEVGPAPAEAPNVKLPGTDPADAEKPLETGEFLKALVDSLGGFVGASAMAIAALVVQLLMLLFRTPLASFAGKWRLLIVYAMSVAAGILCLMVAGVDWKAALLHSQTLASLQVLIHQIWKQFVEKKDEVPA